MPDAVERYCAATDAHDLDAMTSAMAPEVELPSPLSRRLRFKGVEDMRVLLEAVYEVLSDVRWEEPIGEGSTRVVVCHARVGGLRVDDAMHFQLDEQGRIARIRPHLRPWLATTVFALLVGPRVARHPGVLLRALR